MSYKVTPQSLGLDPQKAEIAAQKLNQYLANLIVLYIKVHNLHWNVVGTSFFEIHSRTQMVYEEIAEKIDLVAERIKTIGFYPVGSLQEALKLATIKEIPSRDYNGPTAAGILVHDFRALIEQLRVIGETVGDAYTGDVVGDGLQYFEKQHWLFSAYLTHV